MMWHNGWNGADWVWMSVGMLIFWTLVAVGLLLLIRSLRTPANVGNDQHSGQPRHDADASKARAILDQRYARGEIDDEQYRARRDRLNAP
jgi:putative membrane protein